ncbi:hypothetical protein BH10PLA1_BH10PLA1_22760 [soil metagenome]
MIWLVTNHKETRASLVPLIVGKSYQLTEIECGDEISKRLQFISPRLAIIDCGMPDSFDTLDTIRSEHRGRAIPIIMFCTADEDLKEKALLQGADSYVSKGSLDWLEMLSEISRLAGPGR